MKYVKGGFKSYALRLVAHTLTAALSTTCLQFKPVPAFPVKAPSKLGQAGFAAPRAAAAALARRVGK